MFDPETNYWREQFRQGRIPAKWLRKYPHVRPVLEYEERKVIDSPLLNYLGWLLILLGLLWIWTS